MTLSMHRWTLMTRVADLPTSGGCYAIFVEGALKYIGSSSNLRARMWHHIKASTPAGHLWVRQARWKRDLHRFAVVKYRTYPQLWEWTTREIRLIQRLAPAENRKHMPRRVAR